MVMPLDGIRVLDLTRLLPGAVATMMLADLGADVIKIEDPNGGDYARWMSPQIGGISAFFNVNNRNKRSIILDLKAADGTTNLPVNGSGNPFADSNGYPPDLWGPDGVREMWRQVGTVRVPMYPSTEMFDTLVNGARRNVANTFTAAQSFTSGTPSAFKAVELDRPAP